MSIDGSEIFATSLGAAAFVSVFIVFRYQTVDASIHTRKERILQLLDLEWRRNPELVERIQDIYKDPTFDDASYFNAFENRVVDKFVADIRRLRRQRFKLAAHGYMLILLWVVVASSGYVSSVWPAVFPYSLSGFATSLLATTHFVYRALKSTHPRTR